MEAKLKSISKPIPWSLTLKAAIFGASFYFLPFWIFLLVAAYLYFFPIFGAFRLLFPFIFSLGMAYISARDFWSALVLTLVFLFILGIKELVFIDRVSAYETLVYALALLLFWNFFSNFSVWSIPAIFWSAAAAFLIFLLLRGTEKYLPETSRSRNKKIAAATVAFLIWELNLILLFLPFNFLYQTAFALLASAIFIDFLFNYLANSLSREKILVNLSVFFVLLAVILASVKWKI